MAFGGETDSFERALEPGPKHLRDTLATSEPVTGLKRVELENLVQSHEDNLLDNKITRGVRPAQ